MFLLTSIVRDDGGSWFIALDHFLIGSGPYMIVFLCVELASIVTGWKQCFLSVGQELYVIHPRPHMVRPDSTQMYVYVYAEYSQHIHRGQEQSTGPRHSTRGKMMFPEMTQTIVL